MGLGLGLGYSRLTLTLSPTLLVLEARRTEGEAVPLPAINVIIEACAQLEDLDRAFATWGELEAFGLAPDVHTLTPTLPLPLPRHPPLC